MADEKGVGLSNRVIFNNNKGNQSVAKVRMGLEIIVIN
jgi:accessory gene regulator protein AgrB